MNHINGKINRKNVLSGKIRTLNADGISSEPITITENGTYTAPYGKAYTPVTVNVEGLIPTGTLNITENGAYDVTEKASAEVSVKQWNSELTEILDGTATELSGLPSSVTKIKLFAFYQSVRNLPSEYVQLDSIHFNGDTVLLTDVPRESNCVTEIEAEIDGQRTASQVLYGFDGGGNGGSFLAVMPNTSVWSLGGGNNYSSAFVRTHIKVTPFVTAANYSITVTIDGVSKTRTGTAVNVARNVMIGGCINKDDELNYTIIGTVYGEIKFSHGNGLLAYNYVPVKRLSDNKIGYYDTINSVFKLPIGGVLTAGEEIPPTKTPSIETADLAVTEIGEYAFYNNDLSSLTLRADSVVTLGENAIEGTPIADGTGHIYVPSELVSAYQSNTQWSQYADVISAI